MKKRLWTFTMTGIAMMVLILDSKTALTGARDAIKMCLMTVIPSLFPFFLLSILLTSTLTGVSSSLLRPIGKLCRIPAGSESIFLLGILGGYPTGAQAVAQAYHAGQLSERDAKRMLGFCSNAGPSFLFGIVATAFGRIGIVWLLWAIHILSALITAIVLPGGSKSAVSIPKGKPVSLPQALERSIRIMACVCGWIIVFRVILAFFQRWFLWLLPTDVQILFAAVLELANGCVQLSVITDPGIRFLLSSSALAFGGICVAMQTVSITGSLGLGMYLPGKLIQGCISLILAAIVQHLAFAPDDIGQISPVFIAVAAIAAAVLVVCLRKKEKNSSIPVPIGV